MRVFEDECVGCPPEMGCMGSSCPNRNVLHVFCDRCGEECELNELHEVGGEDVCEKCILEMYPKIKVEGYV